MLPLLRPLRLSVWFAPLGALLALGASTPAHALTWETTEQPLPLYAGTGAVVVEFPFKNTTTAPVTFTGVKSACDCSVPELPKDPIPPGGKGVLKVRFLPGNTLGPRTVPLEVSTDEPNSSATLLYIKARIDPALTVAPALQRWARAADPAPRTVVITRVADAPVTSLALVPPAATVTASLAPGEKPGTWLLTLAPVSTAENLTVRVQLTAEVNGLPLLVSAYVVVR